MSTRAECCSLAEMKLVITSIYTNFRTTIVDDENVEENDAYTVKPRGEKLVLKFQSA